MLVNYLNSIPFYLISAIGIILVSKNLIRRSFSPRLILNILTIIIYTLVIAIIYGNSYKPLQTLLDILALTICLKNLFNSSMLTSFYLSMASLIMMMIIKLIFTFNIFMGNNFIMINNNAIFITNIFIVLFAIIISRIKFINENINEFLNRVDTNATRDDLVIIMLLVTTMIFFYYQFFSNRYVITNNVDFILFIIVLFLLSLVYIGEKIKYHNLINKYNDLITYSCAFEEEMEKDRLFRHEYNNQLAVIRGMSKDKKIIDYIDSILNSNHNASSNNVRGLNNLPNGGLKGVIYYKLGIIKNNNINFSIDVSKSVKRRLEKLSTEEFKIISYIIGICSDNAIDECLKSNNSNISFEIYNLSKEINIVISNTIVNKVNLKKIGEKGYTTKGNGHGNGLFLVKKLIKKHSNITIENKVVNNYYVQHLRIRV